MYLLHNHRKKKVFPPFFKTSLLLRGWVSWTAQGPRASRGTGGGLIMWKIRPWKRSVGAGPPTDEGCPPPAPRFSPYWEQDHS